MEAKPDDPDALLNIAVSYYEKDKLIKAIEAFTILNEKHKAYNGISSLYLSKIYQKNGQLKKAFDIIRKAVHQDIHFMDGFLQYGRVSLEMNNIEKAIDCFKRVIKHAPDNNAARILLEGAKKKYEKIYCYSYDYE